MWALFSRSESQFPRLLLFSASGQQFCALSDLYWHWEHLEASVKSDPNASPSVAEKHGEGGQGTPGQSLVPCFLSFSEDRQLKLSGKSLLTNIPVLTVLLLGSMGLLTSVTEA